MKRIIFHIFLIHSISNCIDGQATLLYPEEDNPFCTTPLGEDGECIKISECVPEKRFLYITEDRRTTLLLRLVFRFLRIIYNKECQKNTSLLEISFQIIRYDKKNHPFKYLYDKIYTIGYYSVFYSSLKDNI